MENPETLGIEVVCPEGGLAAPCCPHGPTLLFEKGRGGRRFYACSACRDRKDCSFFQWEDEKVSEARLRAREEVNRLKQQEYRNRFEELASVLHHEKKFCDDCQMLLLPAEHGAHSAHRTTAVTAAQLRRPSLLLRPLDNKKSNAQYLFTDRSANFLLDSLASLGYTKVLCVGTPRLQELIKLQKSRSMKSLLLDIDLRYAQFYSQNEFCHYNMFNHHFFGGEASSAVLKSFLKEVGEEKVVMVADPPFGGLVKPLANSFSLISQTWKDLQDSEDGPTEMPIIWIFPYFFEPRILECLPSLSMLDYQVDYDNHPLYKHGKTGRRQSPVRLFTNISSRCIILPQEEGYRFCAACQRYVSSLNKHCSECNRCPSKNGCEWKHCSSCEKCVKSSWKHCGSCGRCALPDHPCGRGQNQQGCFSCGGLDHKRKFCPVKDAHKNKPKCKTVDKRCSRHRLKLKAKKKSGAARQQKKMAAQTL
uniref:Zinc finger, CCHC domain containing 4 n=1 Tax=Nothobranchius kadleci TaxID=1051664 RepID=A0A1A8BBG0_NOTKA